MKGLSLLIGLGLGLLALSSCGSYTLQYTPNNFISEGNPESQQAVIEARVEQLKDAGVIPQGIFFASSMTTPSFLLTEPSKDCGRFSLTYDTPVDPDKAIIDAKRVAAAAGGNFVQMFWLEGAYGDKLGMTGFIKKYNAKTIKKIKSLQQQESDRGKTGSDALEDMKTIGV